MNKKGIIIDRVKNNFNFSSFNKSADDTSYRKVNNEVEVNQTTLSKLDLQLVKGKNKKYLPYKNHFKKKIKEQHYTSPSFDFPNVITLEFARIDEIQFALRDVDSWYRFARSFFDIKSPLGDVSLYYDGFLVEGNTVKIGFLNSDLIDTIIVSDYISQGKGSTFNVGLIGVTLDIQREAQLSMFAIETLYNSINFNFVKPLAFEDFYLSSTFSPSINTIKLAISYRINLNTPLDYSLVEGIFNSAYSSEAEDGFILNNSNQDPIELRQLLEARGWRISN